MTNPSDMTNPSADIIPGRFEVRGTASDHFSWLRTRLSVERTMMSWVRTATGLIGFGFAIVQILIVCNRCRGLLPRTIPTQLALADIYTFVMWHRSTDERPRSRGDYLVGRAAVRRSAARKRRITN